MNHAFSEVANNLDRGEPETWTLAKEYDSRWSICLFAWYFSRVFQLVSVTRQKTGPTVSSASPRFTAKITAIYFGNRETRRGMKTVLHKEKRGRFMNFRERCVIYFIYSVISVFIFGFFDWIKQGMLGLIKSNYGVAMLTTYSWLGRMQNNCTSKNLQYFIKYRCLSHRICIH